MEAQTEFQSYLDQGRQELAMGHAREAAIAYAHGAQLEKDNPQVHLGLAEANLALGNYGVVQTACKKVQELQPQGGVEGWTAQAILDLLDRRYERALQSTDKVIELDPTIGYTHALRSQLLRALGQDYDANLARARATRLSYGGRYENCFPALEPVRPTVNATPSINQTPQPDNSRIQNQNTRNEAKDNFSRPNVMRRQMIRTRFTLSQYPGLATNILISINVIVFLLVMVNQNLEAAIAQYNPLVASGQIYRIVTAIFLQTSIFNILLGMFSLFLVGRAVEIFFGMWRYLLIFLLSGIAGGVIYYILAPGSIEPLYGASSAIFGIFGAMGIFYIVNRRALGGAGTGIIYQWGFVLILNLVLNAAVGSTIGLAYEAAGLIAGLILGYLLMPRDRYKHRFM